MPFLIDTLVLQIQPNWCRIALLRYPVRHDGKGGTLQVVEKVRQVVILSGAKDLHLLVFTKILQILRFAQNDSFHGSFCSL